MKKYILSALMLSILCLSLSVSAFAREEQDTYILDELGVLSDEEINELNENARYLSDEIKVDILFVYTNEEDFDTYVDQITLGKYDDQILMIENEESWSIFSRGIVWDVLDIEKEDSIRAAYDREEYYSDGVNAYLYEAALIIAESLEANANAAAASTIILDTPSRLVDMADLLSESEEKELLSQLNEISERQKLDTVVVTVNTLDGKTPMEYADDFYDYNGYGFGEENDGILLLVSMEDRDWWISTTGYGITVFTDAGIDYIAESFLPKLSDGDYATAFMTYAQLCDEFITQAKNGPSYDNGNLPKIPFDFGLNLIIAIVVGLVVAFITTSIMKGQLKSVRFKATATDYLKRDSMKITQSKDLFLYKNVSRSERPKESSSSGGSSTHTSSSGSSHGGGGGKF
ncbi:MAG: TPM domain-containing protein [Lachnospiraceae bacterium]